MNIRTPFSSFAHHSIFLAPNGKLYGWGSNDRGALALASNNDAVNNPLELEHREFYEDGGFTDFAAGTNHNLLLTKGSRIIAWGRNEDGQLGVGDMLDKPHPVFVHVPDGQIPVRVSCGGHFSAFLTRDGSVYTMGYNDSGQLGHGDQISIFLPKKVAGIPPCVDVRCGWSFVLALTSSGELWGWGNNSSKELGIAGSPGPVPSPVSLSISGLANVVCGSDHCLALSSRGAFLAWGWNFYGQLGFAKNPSEVPKTYVNPDSNLEPPPRDPGEDRQFAKVSYPKVIRERGIVEMASGSTFILVLLEDGYVGSCGKGGSGQLGRGNTSDSAEISKILFVEATPLIAGIGCGENHGFVVTKEGDLYIWGEGGAGRLGLGTIGSVYRPELVPEFKCSIPFKSFVPRNWETVFQWLFLGKRDEPSPFFGLPVEVVYHFVTLLGSIG
jgi:alpha-tubulin suppressor-like RCC1 family protein